MSIACDQFIFESLLEVLQLDLFLLILGGCGTVSIDDDTLRQQLLIIHGGIVVVVSTVVALIAAVAAGIRIGTMIGIFRL